MTDYWVSTKKHFCRVCNCWISGNPKNIHIHELSDGHKANSQKLLKNMYRSQREKLQKSYEVTAEIRRMEIEATKSLNESTISKHTSLKNMVKLPVESLDYQNSVAPSITELADPVYSISLEKKKNCDSDSKKVNSTLSFDVTTSNCEWVASIDSSTQTPFYFNPVTGDIRHHDPYNVVEVESSKLGKVALDKEDMENVSMKAVSNLLPSVNNMVDVYRSFLLSNSYPKVNCLSPNMMDMSSSSSPVSIHDKNKKTGYTIISDEINSKLKKKLEEVNQSNNLLQTLLSNTDQRKNNSGLLNNSTDDTITEIITSNDGLLNFSEWKNVDENDSKFGSVNTVKENLTNGGVKNKSSEDITPVKSLTSLKSDFDHSKTKFAHKNELDENNDTERHCKRKYPICNNNFSMKSNLYIDQNKVKTSVFKKRTT